VRRRRYRHRGTGLFSTDSTLSEPGLRAFERATKRATKTPNPARTPTVTPMRTTTAARTPAVTGPSST
jgi:hypothetical protein